ncbi:MAG: acetyl-CoA carboxylase biotin carboxyl carrier protein subunit [Elusimicrobia bacterium CG08_land_8_20_14_0_20_51_18]|nr:MAG: acetyl-CoA carboxylase biotin carboxyl carrier protein subunit [Elusimicrobia bacterium CG08_land_8_20_14_0_20_51_18]
MKKTKNPNGPAALNDVKKFYDFMTSNKLEVLEFSQGETYIKLVRKNAQPINAHPIPVFTSNMPAMQIPQRGQQGGVQQAPQAPAGETIKSPMSGIFYRAPSPSSPPYVREGDTVKRGQVLCIVEAMKVFNETKADFDFKVLKVLVENGKALTLNQDIFLIERI